MTKENDTKDDSTGKVENNDSSTGPENAAGHVGEDGKGDGTKVVTVDPADLAKQLAEAQAKAKDAESLAAKVAEYEEAETAREEAKKSDEQKQAEALATAQKTAEEAQSAAAAEVFKNKVYRAASAAGFNDPDDATKYLSQDSADIETDIAELLEQKPYLASTDGEGKPKPRTQLGVQGGPGSGSEAKTDTEKQAQGLSQSF